MAGGVGVNQSADVNKEIVHAPSGQFNYNKPQMKAPRVTPLEGVSTHGCAMRVRGVENPQGFGIDERRFVAIIHRKGREERKAQQQKSLRPLRSLRLTGIMERQRRRRRYDFK